MILLFRRQPTFRGKSRDAGVHAVIATSGTAAALAGAAQSLRLTRSGGVPLAVAENARRLAKMTDRQRAGIKGINPKRAQIIVAGAAVYAHVLDACGLKGFRYSPLGLRDGILAQMAAEYDQRRALTVNWKLTART